MAINNQISLLLSVGVLVLAIGCGKSNNLSSVKTSDQSSSFVTSDLGSSAPTTTTVKNSEAAPAPALPMSAPSNGNSSSSVEPERIDPDAPALSSARPAGKNSGFNPALLAPGSKKEDFKEEGQITPTVYFKPVVVDDPVCDNSKRVTMHGDKGSSLVKVCPKTLAACSLQGSCTIVRNREVHSYNFTEQIRGVDRFFVDDANPCSFGLGVSSICLDPYYTVAADMKYYKPGDVIFIPALVGTQLPQGKMHNGFFIVRDQGGGINGKGRFDFFTGFITWRDPQNPFAPARLTDSKTHLTFYRVKGDTAKKVLHFRNFPSLPESAKSKIETASSVSSN